MSDLATTPFSVGVYTCKSQLGAGKSGDLFLAVHETTGRECTLRRLSKEVLDDVELVETLLQNLHRAQQLYHPNILAIHEVLRLRGQVYVVMDYVQGTNLLQVLKRIRQTQPLSLRVAAFITSQICQALDHAHHQYDEGAAAPLIHGALWPTNVLLSMGGKVFVTDFGAWVTPSAFHPEAAEDSIRTQFSYRSPEHVTGDELTRASDIFCVGILLYEMLAGRPLFLGGSLMETLQLVENAQTGSLAEVISAPLLPAVERCLARNPEDRYADVTALLSELAVAAPGMGSTEVRQELVQFLEVDVARQKHRRQGLSPQPIFDGAQPLGPPPGMGTEDDEPTHTIPTGVSAALAALSKERTDPEKLKRLATAQPLQPTDGEIDDGPTHLDPVIPGITGPKPEPVLEETTADEDGPTPVRPVPEMKVLWEAAPESAEPETPVVEPQPLQPQVIDDNADPLDLDSEEEATVPASKPPPALEALKEILQQKASEEREEERSKEKAGEETGRERAPSEEKEKEEEEEEEICTEDVPTIQAKPGPPAESTDQHQQPGAPAADAAPSASSPEGAAAPESAPVDGKLEFSFPSEEAWSLDSLPDGISGTGPFDSESSYGQLLGARPHRRFSAAHLLLVVAIIVFVIAVSLLIRRMMQRPSAAPVVHVYGPPDAEGPAPHAPDLSIADGADQLRAASGADAAGADAAGTLATGADAAGTLAASVDAATIHSSGKHLKELLHGLQPGMLSIDSTPAGTIYFNGQRAGDAPLTKKLKPGQMVQVAIVAKGFEVYREDLKLPSDRGIRLRIHLNKGYYPREEGRRRGWLTVRCKQGDQRRISIDGRDSGYSCPRVVFQLQPGRYTIGFTPLHSGPTHTRRASVIWGHRTTIWPLR